MDTVIVYEVIEFLSNLAYGVAPVPEVYGRGLMRVIHDQMSIDITNHMVLSMNSAMQK